MHQLSLIISYLIALFLFSCNSPKEEKVIFNPKEKTKEIIKFIRNLEYDKFESEFIETGVSFQDFVKMTIELSDLLDEHPVTNDSLIFVKEQKVINDFQGLFEEDSILVTQVHIPFGMEKKSVSYDLLLIFLFTEYHGELKLLRFDYKDTRTEGPNYGSKDKIHLNLNNIVEIQCMREGGTVSPTEFLNYRIKPKDLQSFEDKELLDSILNIVNEMDYIKVETISDQNMFIGDPSFNCLGLSYKDEYNYYIFNILHEQEGYREKHTDYITIFEFKYLNEGYLYYYKKTKDLDEKIQRICSNGIEERGKLKDYQPLNVTYEKLY